MTDQRQAGARYQALLGEVDAAIKASNLERAAELAELALKEGPDHPTLLLILAARLSGQGRPIDALALLQRAHAFAPRDIHVLNSLGNLFADLGRPQEALARYEAALEIDPRFAPAHYNRGTVLEDAGAVDGALASYEAAVRLQPRYPEALARMASICALRGDAPGARAFATQALALDPHQIPALLALAQTDLADNALPAACARAKSVLALSDAPQSRAIALGILGEAEDQLGDTAAAFAHFAAAKRELAAHFDKGSRGASYLSRIEALAVYFRTAPPELWARGEGGPRAVQGHVFLIGFPRSGTTLLEQALAGHPHIVTMEERSALTDAIGEFAVDATGLARLAGLSGPPLGAVRDAYWAACRRFVPKLDGRIFIDKMPLNTSFLGIAAKLFPDAKFLLALRDPRDVVFSCFRQRFGMTEAMREFCDLEATARLYVAVMELGALYRERFGVQVLETRYEDLVADFDGTISRLCAYLGIDAAPGMRDVAARGRERIINTPSAAQVARGLYQGGAGQWKRYEAQLAPVLPLLTPWVERFGYA